MQKAEIAITKSLTAISANFQPANNVKAIRDSQKETINPPTLGCTNTIIPAIISITPTIIINVAPEKGSMPRIEGLIYCVQSQRMFVNLSNPATKVTMVKVNFKILNTGWTFCFSCVVAYSGVN